MRSGVTDRYSTASPSCDPIALTGRSRRGTNGRSDKHHEKEDDGDIESALAADPRMHFQEQSLCLNRTVKPLSLDYQMLLGTRLFAR